MALNTVCFAPFALARGNLCSVSGVSSRQTQYVLRHLCLRVATFAAFPAPNAVCFAPFVFANGDFSVFAGGCGAKPKGLNVSYKKTKIDVGILRHVLNVP